MSTTRETVIRTTHTIVSSKLTRAERKLAEAVKLLDECRTMLGDERYAEIYSTANMAQRRYLASAAGAAEGAKDFAAEVVSQIS